MKQVAPKHSLKCLQKQFCQNLFLFSSITVVPQLSFCSGAVSLWHQCVGQDSVYSVSVDRLLRTLSTVYTSRLPEKTSSMADSGTNCAVGVSIHLCVCVCVSRGYTDVSVCVWLVFMCLVERVLDRRLPRRGGSSRDVVMVTLFQLWSYVEANGVSDLETHVTELAEEGTHNHREC